ncbi:MAG: dihydropteroate synthase [Muribaculaceae bacterium]|nr:dihydropteroate synthase [Muribaculaceae bacterium]
MWGRDHVPYTLRCGKRLLTIDRPLVMGIVNSTPDSFYSESRTPESAGLERRIAGMLEAGVDIVDIGGCSTRPGAATPDADVEWQRVETALKAARKAGGDDLVISLDTFRSEIAGRGVRDYGVSIINDISGGDMDERMFQTVADLDVAYVLMHTRGTPATMHTLTGYDDVVADVLSDLLFKADRLHDMGVADIILDPGFGFAKTIDDNYRLLDGLENFARTGMPVLAGLSRKSMIWKTLGATPEDSLAGTIALNMAALERGASILRVHDVREAVQSVELFLKMQRL